MIRVAIEIARAALPVQFADKSDEDVLDGIDGRATVWLSSGERAAIQFAHAAEHLLEQCDRETVDAVLEVIDRLRAGMVR